MFVKPQSLADAGVRAGSRKRLLRRRHVLRNGKLLDCLDKRLLPGLRGRNARRGGWQDGIGAPVGGGGLLVGAGRGVVTVHAGADRSVGKLENESLLPIA